jgi:hypothetical protein
MTAQRGGFNPRWTHEEDNRLTEEVARGLQWAEIAELHGRSVNAVRTEARLIGAVVQVRGR